MSESVGVPEENVLADEALVRQVFQHVEDNIGPIASTFLEVHSPKVHVDIHWVPPTEAMPFHTLVTTGMAQRAMNVPPGGKGCTHAELMLFLPPEWDISDLQQSWVVGLIHRAARVAHDTDSWLWEGHTYGIGDARSAPFVAALLMRPFLVEPETAFLELEDGRMIEFFALACLLEDELKYKLAHRSEGLLNRVEQQEGWWEFLALHPDRVSFV